MLSEQFKIRCEHYEDGLIPISLLIELSTFTPNFRDILKKFPCTEDAFNNYIISNW